MAFIFKIFFIALLFLQFSCASQAQIVTNPPTDTLHKDSLPSARAHIFSINDLLKKNKYLNTSSPVELIIKERNPDGKEILFYILGIVIFLIAMCKAFYSKYFNNIFKVFFNTSLRQNQLTDLLLQAKLPSLIFNCFFAINAGLYAWLVLKYYHLLKMDNYLFIAVSILFIGVVYFGKFIALKFIGWLSGANTAVNQYIFVLFLINKIIGILLIPFIILLAFAPAQWLNTITIASFFVLGIFFLLRYLRSYSLLQNKLKVNGFQFLIYVTGVEILPILILYKLTIVLLA